MQWKMIVAALACSLAAACAGSGEPSEGQMRRAVQAKFEQINANLNATAEACRARAFQNDPMLAMQCLAVCGASGGERCELSFEMTRFEKLGCAPAGDQAGYVCDFVIGFSSNSPFAQGSLNVLTGGGDNGQGRFLRQEGGGWLFLPNN